MKKKKADQKPVVSIIMGSDSDLPVMKEAVAFLKTVDLPYEILIISAHRTPHRMVTYAEGAQKRGIQVIIAGAGGAAHLPGMVAAITSLPVIGVPVPMGHLHGQDALISIVQMPKGVPVATVAIGNAWNAGILAAQIIGAGSAVDGKSIILDKIARYKQEMRDQVLAKKVL